MNLIRFALAIAVASAVVAAQTSEKPAPEFSADRPGFSTSPGVVGQGVIQVEGGIGFSADGKGDARAGALTVGSPLIRFGLTRFAELRVTGDGFRRYKSIGSESHDSASGLSDLSVGAKLAVVHQGRIVPAISLLPSVSIPSGHRAFTSSTYDPSLAVAWAKSLAAGVSVGGTFTGTRASGQQVRNRYTSAVFLSMPAPLRSAGYVEAYSVSSAEPGRGSTWISDAGLSHTVGANLQIDLSAGRQISAGAPCWFVAAGFALRYTSLFRR
jgi:hypothetical protein